MSASQAAVAIYFDLQESFTFWLTVCSAEGSVGAQSATKVCNHGSFRYLGQKLRCTCPRGARIDLCAGGWIQAHHAEKYYSLLLSVPSQIG